MKSNPPENVTEHEGNILETVHRISKLSGSKKRLQPLFHPIYVDMMEKLVDAVSKKEIDQNGYAITKTVPKYIETEFCKFLIQNNPELAQQLLLEYEGAD